MVGHVVVHGVGKCFSLGGFIFVDLRSGVCKSCVEIVFGLANILFVALTACN